MKKINSMNVLMLLLTISFWGCVFFEREPSVEQTQIADSNAKEVVEEKKEINTYQEFSFRNDSILQSIKIEDIKPNQIRFEYHVSNEKRSCSHTIVGIAIDKKPDMDPVLDEDEEGFGYPSIEYIYEKENCYLAIRRSMLEKDKVQIRSSDCNNQSEKYCPIESIGIMR